MDLLRRRRTRGRGDHPLPDTPGRQDMKHLHGWMYTAGVLARGRRFSSRCSFNRSWPDPRTRRSTRRPISGAVAVCLPWIIQPRSSPEITWGSSPRVRRLNCSRRGWYRPARNTVPPCSLPTERSSTSVACSRRRSSSCVRSVKCGPGPRSCRSPDGTATSIRSCPPMVSSSSSRRAGRSSRVRVSSADRRIFGWHTGRLRAGRNPRGSIWVQRSGRVAPRSTATSISTSTNASSRHRRISSKHVVRGTGTAHRRNLGRVINSDQPEHSPFIAARRKLPRVLVVFIAVGAEAICS